MVGVFEEERLMSGGDYAPVDYYERCYGYFALGEAPCVPTEGTREMMRVLDLCRQSAGVR